VVRSLRATDRDGRHAHDINNAHRRRSLAAGQGGDAVTAIDPVCGMPIVERDAVVVPFDGKVLSFCSEFCRQQFVRHPAAYDTGAPPGPSAVVAWAGRRVAYFSMEIALADEIPTYAGGLGVLAGDTLRSCADLDVPIVGVTLVHRKGYFRQELRDDHQIEHAAPWSPERTLRPIVHQVSIEVEGRCVVVGAWRYDVVGSRGHVVPVLLLDTDLPDNDAGDRRLTDHLYGGDHRYRLAQEIVLGVGGVRMLDAVGCSGIATLHLNEGHAAFAPLELLRRTSGNGWDFQSVRARTVFTTHTPVAAGHDQFDWTLVRRVLGDVGPREILEMLGGREGLNMTQLALDLSHYVNGVARRHREVSRDLFPAYEIHQITNGVHSRTWTSPPFRALFDRHLPGWREDPFMLHDALALPADQVWQAHRDAKTALLDEIRRRNGHRFEPDVMTIGFARRATSYKRPGLVLRDPARLAAIAKHRPIQLVFAGKAHPRDGDGKLDITGVHAVAHELAHDVPIVYLEDHDLPLARLLVAGCDLWLNTPLRPLEASGTSGMKAAHNGVPSLSVLDGWWREGHIEGVTGWSIGGADPTPHDQAYAEDAADLYRKLELILPLFYDRRDAWIAIMRQCIALNASYFNSHRMVQQYLMHAYAEAPGRAGAQA
jgi:glycogen phosphorylase